MSIDFVSAQLNVNEIKIGNRNQKWPECTIGPTFCAVKKDVCR